MKKGFPIMLTIVLVLTLLSGCGTNGEANQAEGSKVTSETPKTTETTEPTKPVETPVDVFYEDETLEVIVPFGPGGGTDAFGRFIAEYLGKHTDGSPAVQVVNIAGGGSINGANEFVLVRKHDGLTTLLTSASTHAPYLLGEPAVKYDLKKMRPVVGLPTGAVVYASPETGIKEPKDILNPAEKLIYAGISATGLDLVTLLSFDVLGADVQAILGYEGRGPARVAYEMHESNIDYQTTTAYINDVEPLIAGNKAVPLYSLGQLDETGDIVRDPAFPDIPSIKEFYVSVHGTEPSGTAWDAYKAFVGASFTVQKVIWLHDDAPQEAYDALSKAAELIANDADFNTKATEALGGYKLVSGPSLEKMITSMLNVKPEALDYVKDYLEKNYDIKRAK